MEFKITLMAKILSNLNKHLHLFKQPDCIMIGGSNFQKPRLFTCTNPSGESGASHRVTSGETERHSLADFLVKISRNRSSPQQ